MEQVVVRGEGGKNRCWWGNHPPDYREYHDSEWGFPVDNDPGLFEKICLEGFQAGLSWLTILRKRDRFREVFAGFEPTRLAEFGQTEIGTLLQDPGIVRHRGKIEATINNAVRALDLIDEAGSLARFFWSWAEPNGGAPREIPSQTPGSTTLSKELKSRGWRFVGPTTCYSFMQAMGLVNDHLRGCWVREQVAEQRNTFLERYLPIDKLTPKGI